MKKRFWSSWQAIRFRLAKAQMIKAAEPKRGTIETLPFHRVYKQIPMKRVLVAKGLPKGESGIGMRLLVGTGLMLNRAVPPMGDGLPEVDSDVHNALSFGLTKHYDAISRPQRPAEFEGAGWPDLGGLAVRGPYSIFLERDSDAQLVWDFAMLGEFEHQEGLRSLGLRVLFEVDGATELVATKIDSVEYGSVSPGERDWEASATLALCAATTQLALTRHFNFVHMVSGNHWHVAARNHLECDHPIFQLIWPHTYHSLFTNFGVTKVQLAPNGDFVNMFSFTHQGLMKFFDTMHDGYNIAVIDPEADWERRGLNGSSFDTPTQDNLRELFNLTHSHARRYVDAFYQSDAELQSDDAVSDWLGALEQLIPNGLGAASDSPITRRNLARLIGGYIHEGCAMHELSGTMLWNYQLWPDRNPTRIAKDGRRVPVDVFQRVINNSFSLQLRRAQLLEDYGYLVTNSEAKALFTQFCESFMALQKQYDQTPAGPWRLEPNMLEINMNG